MSDPLIPTRDIIQQLSDASGVTSDQILFKLTGKLTQLSNHIVRYGASLFAVLDGVGSTPTGGYWPHIETSPDYRFVYPGTLPMVSHVYSQVAFETSTVPEEHNYQNVVEESGWIDTRTYPYTLLNIQGMPYAHASPGLPDELVGQIAEETVFEVKVCFEHFPQTPSPWIDNPYGEGQIRFVFHYNDTGKGYMLVSRWQWPYICEAVQDARRRSSMMPSLIALFLAGSYMSSVATQHRLPRRNTE